MSNDPMVLKQMRNEALDMLVLWAASQDYSPEIEEVLKRWASTFGIPDTELNERIMAAASGQLSRPCSASANAVAPASGPEQQPTRTGGGSSQTAGRQ